MEKDVKCRYTILILVRSVQMAIFLRSTFYGTLSRVCSNNSYTLKMPISRKRHTNYIILLQLDIQLTINTLYTKYQQIKKKPHGRYNVTRNFNANINSKYYVKFLTIAK
jgi:hypothetical protein